MDDRSNSLWHHFLPLASAACLFLGCNSPSLRNEITRLEKQLADADARLTAATAQLAFANEQIRAAHTERAKIEAQVRQLQAELQQADDEAVANQRRWEKEQDRLLVEVAQARTDSAKALQQLAEQLAEEEALRDGGQRVGVQKSREPDAVSVTLPEEAYTMPENLGSASDVVKGLAGMFRDMTRAFDGVKDAASAKAALPTFEAFAPKVDELRKQASELPEEGSSTASRFVTSGLKTLGPIIEKVLALPGVKEVLGPVVMPMLGTLDKMAGRRVP